MDPEKMDLDSIDQLAWYRIIHFLDHKSRHCCRTLSRTIKSYVDYMGLQLTVHNINVLKSPDKDAWEDFLSTPEIYFWKVHLTANGNDLTALCITLQHQVEVLKISGFISLDSIVNADWARNIVNLSFHEHALATRLFKKHEDGPTEIRLPFLKKLFMSVQFMYPGKTAESIITRNLATLLHQIRSDNMNTIFVEYADLIWILPSQNLQIELRLALSQCIQSHSKTLQTVIFCPSYTESEIESFLAKSKLEFTSIPFGLKHIDIDFLAPDSPWLQMVSQLHHLEELVGRPLRPGGEFVESRPDNYLTTIGRLLQNSSRTLKYINLYVPYVTTDMPELSLEMFGGCCSLEHLHLEFDTFGQFATNLPMLPTSLKVLHIPGEWGEHVRTTFNSIKPEEIPLMCKFRRLVEFRINACLAFSAEEFVQLIRVLLRLPKLNFLRMSEVAILPEGFVLFSDQCGAFLESLCEGQPLIKPDSNPNARVVLRAARLMEISFDGISKCDSETSTESTQFEDLCYSEFHGSESRSQKARDEMDGCANIRTSLLLPKVGDTRFRIRANY